MSLRKLLLATAVATVALSAQAAQASTGVNDDFEGYGNATTLNFTGFTDLTVQSGSVDLIGSPNIYGLSTPFGTGFVDLDGSTNAGGTLRTAAFSFKAGDVVTLSFELSGNQRGGANDGFSYGLETADGPITFNNVSEINPNFFGGFISLGDLGSGPALASGSTDAGLAPDAPWQLYNIQFTAGNDGSLTAFLSTTSNDNVGPLVDNFSLNIAAVPEPATWAMMLVGFGGMGAAMRARRKSAVAA